MVREHLPQQRQQQRFIGDTPSVPVPASARRHLPQLGGKHLAQHKFTDRAEQVRNDLIPDP